MEETRSLSKNLVKSYYLTRESSDVKIIDTNELDLANNEEDVAYVLNLIEEKLKEVRSK